MKLQVIEVTPKQAQSWLKMNTLNRPIRKQYVKYLADAMKRGEFVPNHQAVALNGTRLLDGQHRLMAVIASGLPAVKMTVVTGAETSTFDTIDIGTKRSHSDIFREDVTVMNPISLIASIAYGRRCTPREVKPIYEVLHKQMREIVALVPRQSRFTVTAIRVGALAAILAGESKQYVYGLYRSMATLETAELPPVAKSFVKQIALGLTRQAGGSKQLDMVVRSFTVFQSGNADIQKVSVKKVADRLAIVRQVYRDALGIS